IGFAEKYGFMYAAVGYHPEDIAKFSEEDYAEICLLAEHPKCVAIGEIGLDYYWDDTRKEEQKEIFKRQIELALKLNKPVIIHDREAHGDSFEIICQYPELRGVFHCYSGSAEMAKELLKRGWYLGFDGPVTYKNARKTIEVLEICPLERILIETDSPYMSPVPKRGKRNDSRNLCHIVEKIAEIKGESPEFIAKQTLENGKKLFGI
ncbi:MAG: TatD family hydrolase, partial [Oscillospiraceae bacterium]|nr:TatD family hydrolase [Oscillospiraceae bacterium]